MNVEELVVEAVQGLKDSSTNQWHEVAADKLFMHNLNRLAASNLGLAFSLSTMSGTDTVYILCNLAFEIGRLYGRSEIVRETLKEEG